MKKLAAIGTLSIVSAFALLSLGGCASAPSAEKLAALPVVTYPDKPTAGGDYIYKLPAGKPIELRMLADGSALDGKVDQPLSTRLGRDLYLHKRWASEDGRHWVDARELIDIHLTLRLPSYETPGPGEMHLNVERKTAP
jgi:hypothetical protein